MAASSLQAVKQVLRKRIRGALASMSEQQRREESQELVRKVSALCSMHGLNLIHVLFYCSYC